MSDGVWEPGELVPEKPVVVDPEPWDPPLEHRLTGSTCSCGEWSAGCGNDIVGQFTEHVLAVRRALEPEPLWWEPGAGD